MKSNLLAFPVRHPDVRSTLPASHDKVVNAHLRYLGQLGQSPGSIYQRRRALYRLAAALPVPLLQASPAQLAAWREQLAVCPATAASYIAHARGFYAWAADAGLLENSPAMRLRAPRLARRLPRPIGEEHLADAIAHAPPRIRPWLVLAGWAGLRAKEIAYLRRECVLDGATPPVLLVDSGAAKGGRERIVPLSRDVLAELATAGLPARGWVFRRADGLPGPNRPWLVSALCNRYLHELGYSETLHTLRHRFATQAYRARHDLRLIQELLGHAYPSTTAGYAAFDQAAAAAVVEQLPFPHDLKGINP